MGGIAPLNPATLQQKRPKNAGWVAWCYFLFNSEMFSLLIFFGETIRGKRWVKLTTRRVRRSRRSSCLSSGSSSGGSSIHGSGNIGRFAGAPMPKKMLSERSKKSGCGWRVLHPSMVTGRLFRELKVGEPGSDETSAMKNAREAIRSLALDSCQLAKSHWIGKFR